MQKLHIRGPKPVIFNYDLLLLHMIGIYLLMILVIAYTRTIVCRVDIIIIIIQIDIRD
jgi:hypothetical protein